MNAKESEAGLLLRAERRLEVFVVFTSSQTLMPECVQCRLFPLVLCVVL